MCIARTTKRRLRVWVCWQSLQVEYTGSFLVFNRAWLLASVCPTRTIPAFGMTIKFKTTKTLTCLKVVMP
jgi:hypothetical protein